MKSVETVIIGAGQSGLAISYELARAGLEHIVLERGQVANSWRQERWDSLRLLTPNWMNGLAGAPYKGVAPDGFMTNVEFICQFEAAIGATRPPVQCETTVLSVRTQWDGYRVETDRGAFQSRNVVLANGGCGQPKIPACAQALPHDVTQLTPQSYKRPSDVPEGDVLVVGASASGMQLARELQNAGRQVTLAVGNHLRFPRHYRDLDILTWMELTGVLTIPFDEVDDLDRVRRTPSLTLVGSDAPETIDLNALQHAGVEIVGRLSTVRDGTALFSGALNNMCRLADLKLDRLLRSIDDWLYRNSLSSLFPPETPIEPTRVPATPRLSMKMSRNATRTVLWATGYVPDFSWLDVPVFDGKGRLLHLGGVVAPGLYALGLPYLRTRQSTHIHGAPDDAKAIARQICDRMKALHVA